MFKNRYSAARSMVTRGAVGVGALMASFIAAAAGPDFTGMTSQVDWATAIAAILLIAGGLSAVYVVLTGTGLINGKLAKGK